MKRISKITIAITMILSLTACASPKLKFNITVVDYDTGTPIQGANLIYRFKNYGSKAMGWGATVKSNPQEKKSDKNGFSSAVGRANMPNLMGIAITKEGYYKSGAGFPKKSEGGSYNKLLNRWEPWPCEITVKLKKIKDPVPMYVKKTGWINVPKQDTPIGYDLEVGDWVAPYGKGKVSDFIFTVKSKFKAMNDRESSYVLTFKNDKDGIFEYSPIKNSQSVFAFPYKCPVNGFKQKLFKYIRSLPGDKGGFRIEENLKRNNTYLFRVRTKINSQGDITSANYGIVSSEIMVYADDKKTLIKFSYYFNPDKHSRSLEYNRVNLFENRDQD